MKKKNTPTPAQVIATNSNEINAEKTLDIEKYKSIIVPHPFCFEIYESFLKDHFDYIDITNEDTKDNQIHMEIFIDNLKACFPHCSKVEPVFIEIIRNNKSQKLYAEVDKSETIYVYMEKNTGYIDTNSYFLGNKLSLLRGVNKEEYDEPDSPLLLHLITVMRRISDDF